MLRSYLAILIRGFRKTPVYSVLNITGLALGIACAALIFLWIEDELSFDQQFAKHNQIYGVLMNIDYTTRRSGPWPKPVGERLEAVWATHKDLPRPPKVGRVMGSLTALTIVMKGEELPPHSQWQGAPAQPV